METNESEHFCLHGFWKNKNRFKQNGELKINDNTLVALALLVAQSNPSDKELVTKLLIQLVKNQ